MGKYASAWLYGYPASRIRATIARFYMTTRTTLSDEEMVQRRNMHHTPSDSAPFSAYFLIANARLEFSANYRKDSPLKISNRERIAIFHPHSHMKVQGRGARGANMPLACPEEACRRRRAPEFLIATFEQSENQSNSWKQRTKQNSKILIATKTPFPQFAPVELSSVAPASCRLFWLVLVGPLLVVPNNFAGHGRQS
jgi:hypothetical protein